MVRSEKKSRTVSELSTPAVKEGCEELRMREDSHKPILKLQLSGAYKSSKMVRGSWVRRKVAMARL